MDWDNKATGMRHIWTILQTGKCSRPRRTHSGHGNHWEKGVNLLTLSKPCITGHFQSLAPPNMFNSLPSLSTPKWEELHDELDRYLSTDSEAVEDVLMWWDGHHEMYPYLSHMALDYLMIPGMYFHPSTLYQLNQHLTSNICWCWVNLQSWPPCPISYSQSAVGTINFIRKQEITIVILAKLQEVT